MPALDAAAAKLLPEPSPNPTTMSAGADDTAERELRPARDLISGKY